ncbi:MAG: RluA family pseudouridine synthase [Oscillospiraceae bacterium]
MRRVEYQLSTGDEGQCVEAFLLSQGYARRLVVALKQLPEGLMVEGKRVRSTTLLHADTTLVVSLPDETPRAMQNTALSIPILYEDEDLVVYDKPAGLPCHRSGGHLYDTIENAYGAGIFRAVYRLDRDTSGALLVAHHQMSAGRLWQQVQKRYIAVASGRFSEESGEIRFPLLRESPYEPRQIASPDGRPALTQWHLLWQDDEMALLECVPETGRMHQIRVHLAEIGHPLLGDALYGGNCNRIGRQALHCATIRFLHPMTGQQMKIFSPLPQDLRLLLETHGKISPYAYSHLNIE